MPSTLRPLLLFPLVCLLLCAAGTAVVAMMEQSLLASSGDNVQVLEVGNGRVDGRPAVFVECREGSLQFLPEGPRLTVDEDLEADTTGRFHSSIARQAGTTDRVLVVLVVRPSGISACRAASRMLQERNVSFIKEPVAERGRLVLESWGEPWAGRTEGDRS